MANKISLETLEKRIAALENLASQPTVQASSVRPGLVTGLSPLQDFFLEAERRFNETVPVYPFPGYPFPPVQTPCETQCWIAYLADLNNAAGDIEKRLKAVEDYRICMRCCKD